MEFLIKNREQLLWVAVGVLLILGLFWVKELLIAAVGFIAMLFGKRKATPQEVFDEHAARMKAEREKLDKQAELLEKVTTEAGIQRKQEIDDWADREFK